MQTPMIQIGSRAVLANFPNLQLPKGDEARIAIDVMGWKLQVVVTFDDSAAGPQAIEVKPEADGVRLVLKNWSNSLGTCLQVPAQIAALTDGSRLEFMATNYRIGETNLLSLQLLHSRGGKQ